VDVIRTIVARVIYEKKIEFLTKTKLLYYI